MGDTVWIILAGLLLLAGAVGTIAPVLPGLPLSWGGLLVLKFLSSTRENISWQVIMLLGALTLVITALDNLLPIWGTRKMGGNKSVVWGASIGLLLGFFLGPWGIILGPFAGAFIGGVVSGNRPDRATRQATGVFIGYMTGLVLKLATAGLIIFFFVRTLIL